MQGIAGEGEGDLPCSYGTKYLLKQISALRKEIPGVMIASDIEHIHRMRVATRRLRSAFPLFPLCFPPKKMMRWRRDLRNTARALGKARDSDVQITFLTEYISDLRAGRPLGNRLLLPSVIPEKPYPVPFKPEWYHLSISYRKLVRILRSLFSRALDYLGDERGEGNPADENRPPKQADLVPGMEYILFRKSQERLGLQKEVEKAIWRLEKTGILGEMEKYLLQHRQNSRGSSEAGREIFANAYPAVALHIDDLLALSASLADPEKSDEHHAMRIAVKRLRYTLEVWRDLFKGNIRKEIDTLKGFQDLLGDLHDCDVWLEYLPEFLEEEETRCRAFFGNDTHFKSLVPGIEAFSRERRERKGQLHEIALTTWRELANREFLDGIREKFLAPLAVREGDSLRIGLVSNISGDAAALRRVLADCYSRGAWLVLNAGDTLGSPRGSGKTVQILRNEGIISIATDRDRLILDRKSPAIDEGDKSIQSRQRQSKDTRRYIRALPSSLRFSLGGKSIVLTNESLDIPRLRFDERTPREKLCQIAQETGASVIVSGHHPLPFRSEACGVIFVHPGSVRRGGSESLPSTYTIMEIGSDASVTITPHEIPIKPEDPGCDGSPHLSVIPSGIPEDDGGNRQSAGH